jgi:hypothetical protein
MPTALADYDRPTGLGLTDTLVSAELLRDLQARGTFSFKGTRDRLDTVSTVLRDSRQKGSQ